MTLIESLRTEGIRQSDLFNDGQIATVGDGPYLLGCAADELERKEARIERLEKEINHLNDRLQYWRDEALTEDK